MKSFVLPKGFTGVEPLRWLYACPTAFVEMSCRSHPWAGAETYAALLLLGLAPER